MSLDLALSQDIVCMDCGVILKSANWVFGFINEIKVDLAVSMSMDKVLVAIVYAHVMVVPDTNDRSCFYELSIIWFDFCNFYSRSEVVFALTWVSENNAYSQFVSVVSIT